MKTLLIFFSSTIKTRAITILCSSRISTDSSTASRNTSARNGFAQTVYTFVLLRAPSQDTGGIEKIIGKLAKYGIKGSEQDCFRSYLSERSQFVSLGGTESQRRKISHGVPQGSVLGPTLFSIHINGISAACHNYDVVLYADDTEIHAISGQGRWHSRA